MNSRPPDSPAPPVYRPSRMAPQMKAAPPVYRPHVPSNSLQAKPALPIRLAFPAAGLKPQAAPPVYKPHPRPPSIQPKIRPGMVAPAVYKPHPGPRSLQPKAVFPPVYNPYLNLKPGAVQPKVAGLGRHATIQRSSKKVGFSKCEATVTGSEVTGTGAYKNSIHGEINALEDYLQKGGALKDIEEISISSPPCKYCYIILGDLGVRDKVVHEGEGFGSCSGGSYGWFDPNGKISALLQVITKKKSTQEFKDWEKAYCGTVSARIKDL